LSRRGSVHPGRAGPGYDDRGPRPFAGWREPDLGTVIGILLVLGGCSGASDHAPPALAADSAAVASTPRPSTEAVLRGLYSFGHEVRAFRPCGSTTVLWVRDQTGLLRRLHEELRPGAEPYEAIFTVVAGTVNAPSDTGFGADYDGELTVREIRYAAPEGLGCDSDWSFHIRASGNEPFWTATVDGSGLHLGRPGEPERAWPDASVEAGPDRTRITVPSDTSVGLELQADSCRDSMSGAFSPWAARLRVGDRVFSGCAVAGEGIPGG